MLLRRVIKHVQSQNWLAVLIDFFIVVVGVFIGIQVANWNASLAEAERERGYLLRLQEEFAFVRERNDLVINFANTSLDAINQLSQAWKSGPEAFEANPLPELGQLFIATIASVVPPSPPAAFQELVSSGELSIIKNEELRAALYRFAARTKVHDISYQNQLDGQRQLRQLIGQAFVFDMKSVEQAFLANTIVFDTERVPVTGQFIGDAFFRNPAMRGELNATSLYVLNSRVLAESLQPRIDQIELLINEELSR